MNTTDMTKIHPNGSFQVVTEPFSKTRRVAEASAPRSSERTSGSTPPPNTSIRPNWEMVALWSFVVVSFAALFSCGLIIWAKCHGD